MTKKCCFIGHRKIEKTDELIKKIDGCLQVLIDEGVRIFLFGSKSEFDTLCYERVAKLKERYPDIKRIAYTCKSEYACKVTEKEKIEDIARKVTKKEVTLKEYEGEEQSKRLARAGKASYVERNEDMLNASDYCVFYYNPQYKPPKRKRANADLSEYQPPSGTALAYEYARKRQINNELKLFNLYDNLTE